LLNKWMFDVKNRRAKFGKLNTKQTIKIEWEKYKGGNIPKIQYNTKIKLYRN